GDGDEGCNGGQCRVDHDACRHDEIRKVHAQSRHHQARAGVMERHVLPGYWRPERELRYYAAPINIPTASTMAPPSTIWNTAWRNGVSMYRARMKAIAHNSKNTTTPAIAVAIQNALGHESGTR